MGDAAHCAGWFHQSQKPDARLRLFCFPHAGGGAAKFYTWASELSSEIEALPAKLPGREERFREPAIRSLPELVESLGAALPDEQGIPFAFLGHSMGALVAFELARLLRREGRAAPACLFVAACPAPQALEISEPLHKLPDAEFFSQLRARYGGVPEAVAASPELTALLLPTIRADFTAVETYAYREEPPLDCPIIALAGDEDGEVSVADVSAWRRQTAAAFSLHIFPGGHFFLHDAPRNSVRLVNRRAQAMLGGG